MSSSSIALQGMQQAEAELQITAATMANVGTGSAGGSNADVVDLSAEMIAMMKAQASFEASLATLETADQMQQALLDVTA